jgi:acyl carrier protein
MEREEVVKAYLVDNFLYGDSDGLTRTSSLIETGVVDSTGILELVGFVEETFGVTVEDRDIVPENFDSIEKIVSYIGAKLPAESSLS